jgi:hypothetical protein
VTQSQERCDNLGNEGFSLTGTPIGDEAAFREFLRSPAPVHYCLGRPLTPVFALNPEEISAQVERLTRLCRDRIHEGAVIRVAGDWLSEASVYTVLSLTLTRLRKLGYSESVCGSPRTSTSVPARPDSAIVALVGSEVYHSLDAWGKCHPGNVVILAEPVEDPSGPPDMVISAVRRKVIEALAEPFVLSMRNKWSENEGNFIGDSLLRCASGVDLPPGHFGQGPIAAPFVLARRPDDEPTDWSTVEGCWLARHALRDALPPDKSL